MASLLRPPTAGSSSWIRRKSNTFVDAIHDSPQGGERAPGQLYSTESGRLWHAGSLVIATVGLPARGKTHTAVALARYLRWLGVKIRIFHLGDYRRAEVGPGNDVPEDYFHVDASPASLQLRQKILRQCKNDIYHFLNEENGQIAIYDAVNPIAAGRRRLAAEFAEHDIQTLFIESVCTDEKIIEENVRSVKISSPDYNHWDTEKAVKDYLARIAARIPHFESMEEEDLRYIKMLNAGQRLTVNNAQFGYLSQRIVFYLLNLHIKFRQIYFVRAGATTQADSYKADAPLSEDGQDYAKKMTAALINARSQEQDDFRARTGAEAPMKALTVWTSSRRRTAQTAAYLQETGYKVRQRTQMSQLNPGVCQNMTEAEIRRHYPEEALKHEADAYNHRYPRAESYHDLAVRLEPIILELEREQNDLLLIAHESVLRVLYGYLMSCNAADIPNIEFPRDQIIEIIPASYQNMAKRINIPDLAPQWPPAVSTDGHQIAMPVSGSQSPMSRSDSMQSATPDQSTTSLSGLNVNSGTSSPRNPGDALTIGRRVNVNPSS